MAIRKAAKKETSRYVTHRVASDAMPQIIKENNKLMRKWVRRKK